MPPLARERSSSQYSDLGSRDSYPDCRGRVKCVLVGDGAVGKTSLIVSYTTNGYPLEYIPTAFDNYNVVVNVDDQPILLQLCDTAGQDDFDSLRGLCYPGTDVYVVCFSVVSPASFTNVAARWLPEIRQYNPQAAVILVGTQTDLRSDVKVLIELARYREHPVSEVEARRLAETLGAAKYVECSALTQKNLKEVFDEAILLALRNNEELRRITVGRSKSRRILTSLQQWRGSFSSDRGGLLRSSRRSKSSKDGAESSSSTVSSSTIQQHCVSKDRASRISQSSKASTRTTPLWRRLCCLG